MDPNRLHLAGRALLQCSVRWNIMRRHCFIERPLASSWWASRDHTWPRKSQAPLACSDRTSAIVISQADPLWMAWLSLMRFPSLQILTGVLLLVALHTTSG